MRKLFLAAAMFAIATGASAQSESTVTTTRVMPLGTVKTTQTVTRVAPVAAPRCGPNCTGECEYARTMRAQQHAAVMPKTKKSPFEFGIKGGLNTGNFRVKSGDIPVDMEIKSDSRTGFHAGVYAQLKLGDFFIQPEGLYSWDRYDIKVWHIDGGAIVRDVSAVRVRALEVPVLAGWSVGSALRLVAGPVFSFENRSFVRGGIVTDSDLLRPEVAFTFGAGVDLGERVGFDLRWRHQFKKDGNTVTVHDRTLELGNRFRGMTLSLSYKLLPVR